MASATDIITYIGIPLAVLGVLPILYTVVLSIFTRRRIRSLLVHHGHIPMRSTRQRDGFTIRSSPMTSLIEVELPRYTIAPLERQDERYWKTSEQAQDTVDEESHKLLDRTDSTLSMVEEGRVNGFLRGGSWRAFQWKKLIVGRRLYRIQYEDELREPPAEIDFSELVLFLLDWGAVPDTMGWEKLKANGLWTPAGTPLLRRPVGEGEKARDWVLRTNMPDESDGVISLTVRWPRDHHDLTDVRGVSSLPPGWGRLRQPSLIEAKEQVIKERRSLPDRIEELKLRNRYTADSTSMRFCTSDNVIRTLRWESHQIETGFISEPFTSSLVPSTSAWFSAAAAALLANNSSNLWNYHPPQAISDFCRRESVPCGVLVHLGLLDESAAPSWTSETTRNVFDNPAARHFNRHLADANALKLEATMPPEQAQIHKKNREMARHQQMVDEMRKQQQEREERRDTRLRDAVASPRLSNKAFAEAALAWLIDQGDVGRECTVAQLAEAVLYLLALDTADDGQGMKIVRLLDEWMEWSTANGMKKRQVEDLEDLKVEFCYAAALVATIANGAGSIQGQASQHMLECLKTWRKVRLG